MSVKKILKSVNIYSQSYKQKRGCLMHFVRLAITLLKDEESTRDNRGIVIIIILIIIAMTMFMLLSS